MTNSWSFSYDSFLKFQVEKIFGSHNMTMLYPNPYCNEDWYMGTALYKQLKAQGVFTHQYQMLLKKIPPANLLSQCDCM